LEIPAVQKITFHTKELEICSGLLTEISEDVWAEVIGDLTSVTVMTEEQIEKEDPGVAKGLLKVCRRAECYPPWC